MNKQLLDLYSDYLIRSFNQTTATGLSKLLDGSVSHDKISRFLAERKYTSKDLWKEVKSTIRQIESDTAVLIVDDTIQEKPYSDENELICWHYDHSTGRTMKGINILNMLYSSDDAKIPVAFELIERPVVFSDIATKKQKRKSNITKNQLMQKMLTVCTDNQLKYRYVLADSWFSASDNMNFVHHNLNKHFVFALKSNRTVALSMEDKKAGNCVRIDSLNYPEGYPLKVWMKGMNFPVLLHRQIFTNKDGSTGILYLTCSDLTCTAKDIETIYKKRWSVEVFHKTIKSNTALAKSPTKVPLTQGNHVFMSIYSAFKLECLSLKYKMNHFALKAKLYITVIRQAFDQLRSLKSCIV